MLLLLAFGCAGTRQLPAPPDLPESARALLTEKMIDHGQDMTDLLWATLFLDEDSVKEIARHIVEQPRFSRPLTQDAAELNSRLPPEFFALQDELITRANELAESADSRDPNAVATAYGQLAQTCVRCHSVYLTSEPTRVSEGSLPDE